MERLVKHSNNLKIQNEKADLNFIRIVSSVKRRIIFERRSATKIIYQALDLFVTFSSDAKK